ncbi:MAG: flavodoxin domain-containing protein, partial [Oscillospiraceae bacterium]|nr:flavodoxin domain-containing protein [Oscillospiraceae bacterium]
MTGIYFSGTGNTKFCAEKFLEHFGDTQIFSIEDSNAVPAISESRDIVFAYPIYYSNIPKIVRDFIERNSALWHGKNIYIIATMGLFSGDGSGVSARLFKKFGANVIGGLHLKMPDCIGDVKALKKPYEKNLEIVKAAVQKISNAAEDYKNKKPSQEGLNFMYHMAGLFGQRL